MTLVLTHRPARGNVNTAFGPRPKPTPSSPANHYGLDYGWGGGDTVYAAAAGIVKSYGYSGAYGNRLVIDHGNGWETWYCHLTRNSVPVGEWVAGGEEIGVMGSTGNTVGKHLHFEVRRNGVAVDPQLYFSGSSPAGLGGNTLEEEDMASEASVQEGNRIGNVNYVLLREALGKIAEIQARLEVGATEASVQEAVRVANATWDLTGQVLEKPSEAVDVTKLAAAMKSAGIVVNVDGPALAKMLDASLKDDFAKIPAAVRAAIVK